MDIKESFQKYRALWIIGGIGAVALILFILRSRSSAGGEAPAAAYPEPQFAGGGGGGISVSAPTQSQADQYQAELQQQELEAGRLRLQQYQQSFENQQAQFDLQQHYQEALAPSYEALGRAQLETQQKYEQFAASREISCPGTASVRRDPQTGQLYCREKTSGGFVGAVNDIIGGVSSIGRLAGAVGSVYGQITGQLPGYYGREASEAHSSGGVPSGPFQGYAAPLPAGQFNNPQGGRVAI